MLLSKKINKKTNKYSSIAKELIKLGFIGDVEGYIENEGRELVEESFELFRKESANNVKNKVGLLREKVKALKIRKDIEKTAIEEEKTYGENIFLKKLDKYKDMNTDFLEDYKRFIDIPSNSYPMDQKVLQKHLGQPLNKIPTPILNDFIMWRVG